MPIIEQLEDRLTFLKVDNSYMDEAFAMTVCGHNHIVILYLQYL